MQIQFYFYIFGVSNKKLPIYLFCYGMAYAIHFGYD